MKVLIIAVHDWAGMGNLLTESLRSVGVDARFYVTKASPYKFPVVAMNKVQTKQFARQCDIVQYMHSEQAKIGVDISKKKIVIFHGGGKFRNNSHTICNKFNSMVDCSIIQTYDLLGLGAKNEKWLLPPVDTKRINPVYETEGEKIIVGHYPSAPRNKGSHTVNKLIKRIRNKVPDFEYRYSYEKVPWKQQIKRMSQVDIYIERMSLKSQGKRQTEGVWFKTGVWGVTALEAAALGKVVVTNFFGHKRYKKDYGECHLQIANSEKDMEELLIKLLSTPKDDLLQLKQQTRHWAETHHSFKAVGNRLKMIYEEI